MHMAILKWNAELDTGIDVIDGQHRRIVDYVNQLHEARERGDAAAVGEVIESTVEYTLSHFAFEESLMEDAGYPLSKPHKKVHELFVKRVADLRMRFRAGEDISAELHGLLSRWLVNHIRNDDHDYVESVKRSMNRLAAETHEGGWLSRSLGRFFGGR
jgi:hemerythrin